MKKKSTSWRVAAMRYVMKVCEEVWS